ncbi:MAG: TRAP transporter fused permease subunit [bacterium]|nr:TRAP transporter fused permease subunit [bacterium]
MLLCLFTLAELNYPQLMPQTRLAIFAMLGLLLCFINIPAHPRLRENRRVRALDVVPAALAVACTAYIVVQTQPVFRDLWIGGESLGNRAGSETGLDTLVGILGLLVVLEATRRSIGWALPALALVFLAYAWLGPWMPDWLFPHRGYGVDRMAPIFLHSQGVFGTALRVMFTYVFLFVILGALLKQSGSTQFIIDFAQRLFGSTPGGPAKVAVLSSGMMGSLSGSAVANTATTGTFTIPMMRSSGFRPEIAAGVEAAASSGGALVPPVMGAGAYMMLEIVDPPVTYLQIIKAALIPAVLYYLSLLLIVHFYARRTGVRATSVKASGPLFKYEAVVFSAGFAGLIALLFSGYTVFRAVSIALAVVLVASVFHSRTRIGFRKLLESLAAAGREVVPLVSAAACVGIVIGVVTMTGVGTKLPATILDLAQGNLIGALVLIMVSSIVLGMGLPSAVCYLLMATLINPVLGDLGVVPLGAHLFIFYFGMMSMVTPPVALAAYTAGTIAGAGILQTSFAAFRFALVGFTLPYMFVLRPQLLMLDESGGAAGAAEIAGATVLAVLGIVPFAAGIAGYLVRELTPGMRAACFVAALMLLLPAGGGVPWLGFVGLALFAAIAIRNRPARLR